MTIDSTNPAEVVTTPDVPPVQGTPKAETPIAPPVVPAAPQYLTKEEAQQLLAEAVRAAKETGRREMQSEQDKRVRDAIREQQRAKRELDAVRGSFTELDEDTRNRLELNGYRAKEKSQAQLDEEDLQRQAIEASATAFKGTLAEYATDVGIDPQHKDIDWAEDAVFANGVPDLQTRQKRFLTSVGKIQKAEIQQRQAKEKQLAIDIETRIRKSLGIETVNVGTVGAVTDEGIPTKLDEFRVWVDNLSLAEYEKLAPKINKMRQEGKIK